MYNSPVCVVLRFTLLLIVTYLTVPSTRCRCEFGLRFTDHDFYRLFPAVTIKDVQVRILLIDVIASSLQTLQARELYSPAENRLSRDGNVVIVSTATDWMTVHF